MTKSIKRPILVGAISVIFTMFLPMGMASAAVITDYSLPITSIDGFVISSLSLVPPNYPNSAGSGIIFRVTAPAPAANKAYVFYQFADDASLSDWSANRNYQTTSALNNSVIWDGGIPGYSWPFFKENILIAEVNTNGSSSSYDWCMDLTSCSYNIVATIGTPPVLIETPPSESFVLKDSYSYYVGQSIVETRTGLAGGAILPYTGSQTITNTCKTTFKDYGTYTTQVSQTCTEPAIAVEPPLDDDCGFKLLAPTSWVICIFVPTQAQLNSLFTSFDNKLSDSGIGEVLDYGSTLISPITSTWASSSEGCAGVPLDIEYTIISGASIIIHEHPFSTCEPGFVRDMAKNWALPIQSFIIIFGSFVIISNMILSALSLGNSLFTRSENVDTNTGEISKGWRRRRR
jgi:hypothetical protein